MPKYDYTCDTCGHDYTEYRDVADRIWHTDCVVPNCPGKFVEVK